MKAIKTMKRATILRRSLIGAALLSVIASGYAVPVRASVDPRPAVITIAQSDINGVISVDRTIAYGGPGTGFWQIATLRSGASINIMGASGAFFKTRAANRNVWVEKTAVTLPDGTSVPEIAVPPIGTVTVGNAALRNAPGINASRKAVISNGEQFFIVGRQPDGQWLQIDSRWGRGWIAVSSTDVVGAVPAVAETATPRIIVNTAFLNIRSGPGSEYTVIGTLSGGDEAPIIGKTEDGVWVLVRTGAGDGWVRILYVISRDYNGNVPTVTDFPEANLDTTGRILGTGAVNLRTAPNPDSRSIAVLYATTTVTVLGQSADGRWWYVKTTSGEGWVTKQFVSAPKAANDLPVVQ